MNKLDIILLLITPLMRTAAALLRNKDANSTGVDDELAEAIEHAITRLEKYQANKNVPGANV